MEKLTEKIKKGIATGMALGTMFLYSCGSSGSSTPPVDPPTEYLKASEITEKIKGKGYSLKTTENINIGGTAYQVNIFDFNDQGSTTDNNKIRFGVLTSDSLEATIEDSYNNNPKQTNSSTQNIAYLLNSSDNFTGDSLTSKLNDLESGNYKAILGDDFNVYFYGNTGLIREDRTDLGARNYSSRILTQHKNPTSISSVKIGDSGATLDLTKSGNTYTITTSKDLSGISNASYDLKVDNRNSGNLWKGTKTDKSVCPTTRKASEGAPGNFDGCTL